jgi:hypothetical protein
MGVVAVAIEVSSLVVRADVRAELDGDLKGLSGVAGEASITQEKVASAVPLVQGLDRAR